VIDKQCDIRYSLLAPGIDCSVARGEVDRQMSFARHRSIRPTVAYTGSGNQLSPPTAQKLNLSSVLILPQ
jgi:hypothetical protein